jgi:NAD(P)-dependent dehydrogenase (short-subunit alcohol dehydrogenase family)
VSGIADIEDAHGPITGLVNAAGVFGKMHTAARVRMDNWDREINIDLRGTFLVTRGVGIRRAEWGRAGVRVNAVSPGSRER